jgi:hypothetical protein
MDFADIPMGMTLGAIQVGLSINIGREEFDTEEVFT